VPLALQIPDTPAHSGRGTARMWTIFHAVGWGTQESARIRTVRITTPPQSIAPAHYSFDRTIHLGALSDLSDLPDLLEGERIVDMQMTETVAEATNKGLDMTPQFESERLRDRREYRATRRGADPE
jgi:hypothetical protein